MSKPQSTRCSNFEMVIHSIKGSVRAFPIYIVPHRYPILCLTAVLTLLPVQITRMMMRPP